jgi:Tol biopolymer transport system component
MAAADGSRARTLTQIYDGAVFAPTWSPDGQRLAFTRCPKRRCSVYVIDADGAGERRLVPGSWPTWSPDGRSLAYAGADGRLRIVSVGSGRSRAFPGPPIGPANGLSWSPDGNSILFYGGFYGGEKNHNDLRDRLFVVPARGGRAHVVSRTPGFYVTSGAAWSADSKLIAYSRRDRIGGTIGADGAYVAAADGSSARLFGEGAYQAPRFTPDGKEIAFTLGLGCKVRVVTVATGAARTLPFEACEPVWRRGTQPP